MKQLFIIGLFTLAAIDLSGQVKGKIFVNGQEFQSDKLKEEYFGFRPLKAKLSKDGKKYLDTFAHHYLIKIGTTDTLKIVIDPAQTFKEMKIVNNQIGLARAWTAHDYLKTKYGIEIAKAVVRETVTACILTGTINKRAKKKDR